MAQTVYLVFFVIVCKFSLSLAREYYVSDEIAKTQADAEKLCKLAEPEIQFSSSGNLLSLGTTLSDVEENQELWLGYVQTFVTLAYEGCSSIKDIDYDNTSNVIAEPGQCVAFCGERFSHVGISIFTCYCITSFKKKGNKLLNENCNQACYSQGHLCGGQNGSISIYTIVSPPVNNYSMSTGRCLAFSVDNDKQWKRCSEKNRWACRNDSTASPKNIYGKWDVIVRSCIAYALLPIKDLSSVSSLLTGTLLFWSAVIRSETIKGLSDNPEKPWLATGYAVYKNGKFDLEFQTSKPRKALCVSEGNVTTSTMAPTTTGTETKQTTIKPFDSTTKTDTNVQIVALSVGIPVAIVLVAVIVALIICKRRKESKSANDGQQEPDHSVNNNERQRDNQIDSQRNYNHTYHVLERDSSDYATATNEVYESGSDYYSTANAPKAKVNIEEEDAYDHTDTKTNQTIHDMDGHVYNTTDKDDVDLYDHTNDKIEPGQVDMDVYNTLERKHLYDRKTDTAKKSQVDDDVYNKLEDDLVYNTTKKLWAKKSMPDNVYNVLGKDENTCKTADQTLETQDTTHDITENDLNEQK